MLWIDFETRSECDLTARGAYNYALDASTQVLCMAWAVDDGEVSVWTPEQPFPQADAPESEEPQAKADEPVRRRRRAV